MFYDPYRVLGVNSSMSLDDIRKVYRKLAKTYHPDSPNGDVAKFKKVKDSWEIIKSQKESNNKVMGFGVGSFTRVTHKSLFSFRRV